MAKLLVFVVVHDHDPYDNGFRRADPVAVFDNFAEAHAEVCRLNGGGYWDGDYEIYDLAPHKVAVKRPHPDDDVPDMDDRVEAFLVNEPYNPEA